MITDWKQQHANETDKSLLHPLVADVIAEFEQNMHVNYPTTKGGLMGYGIRKVAMYAAQVARAHALGFDPDALRLTPTEANTAMMELAQRCVEQGKPVAVVVPPSQERRPLSDQIREYPVHELTALEVDSIIARRVYRYVWCDVGMDAGVHTFALFPAELICSHIKIIERPALKLRGAVLLDGEGNLAQVAYHNQMPRPSLLPADAHSLIRFLCREHSLWFTVSGAEHADAGMEHEKYTVGFYRLGTSDELCRHTDRTFERAACFASLKLVDTLAAPKPS